jgi:N-acylneuraminate cytidylyltransferase
MSVVAIIPARGGSKRFPGKNVKEFLGKPLIAHSIEYALGFSKIDAVYVSTDDVTIRKVALACKAITLDRPAHLASDESPTAATVQFHCEEWDRKGLLPDWVVLLQPTNPIRPFGLLEHAFGILEQSHRSSLVTFSPLHRKFGLITDGHFMPENYALGQRMQDITPRYFENGLLYIVRGTEALKGDLFGKDPYPMILEGPETLIDIDEPQDLVFAETLCKSLKINGSN